MLSKLLFQCSAFLGSSSISAIELRGCKGRQEFEHHCSHSLILLSTFCLLQLRNLPQNAMMQKPLSEVQLGTYEDIAMVSITRILYCCCSWTTLCVYLCLQSCFWVTLS